MSPLPAPQPDAWPPPPPAWSPSALHAVEACPRRWALQRAHFDAYDGPFPRRPAPAAIAGRVVHKSVERVIEALRDASVRSVRAPETAEVLRRLGGLSAVVRVALDEALAEAAKSPRFQSSEAATRRKVEASEGELREAVQSTLSSLPSIPERRRAVPPRPAPVGATPVSVCEIGRSPIRRPLRDGAYTEIDLRSNTPPLYGRADILFRSGKDTHIIDVKTGSPSPSHEDQVRLYGLAWLQDGERNPSGDPAITLSLQYGAQRVPVPSPNSWEEYQATVEARVEAACGAVRSSPPPARPERDRCRHCGVRAVCDVYTASPSLWYDQGAVFRDMVVDVSEVQDVAAPYTEATVRLAPGRQRPVRIKADSRWTTEAGGRYIILDGREVDGQDDKAAFQLLIPTSSTEVFEIV